MLATFFNQGHCRLLDRLSENEGQRGCPAYGCCCSTVIDLNHWDLLLRCPGHRRDRRVVKEITSPTPTAVAARISACIVLMFSSHHCSGLISADWRSIHRHRHHHHHRRYHHRRSRPLEPNSGRFSSSLQLLTNLGPSPLPALLILTIHLP